MKGSRLRFKGYVIEPSDVARVRRAVALHPGSSIRELCKVTGLGPHKVRGCVEALSGRRSVSVYRRGSALRVYPGSGPRPTRVQADLLLREPAMQRLRSLVESLQNHTQEELVTFAAQWGWPASTTKHRLKRLVDADLVKRELASRRTGTTLLGAPIMRDVYTYSA